MSFNTMVSTQVPGLRGPGLTGDDKSYLDGVKAAALATSTALSTGAAFPLHAPRRLRLAPSDKVMLYGGSTMGPAYPWLREALAGTIGAQVYAGGYDGYSAAQLASDAQLGRIFDYAPRVIVAMLGDEESGAPGTVGTFSGVVTGEAVVAKTDITADYAGTTFIQAVSHFVRKVQARYYNIRARAGLTGTETEAQKAAKIDAVAKPVLVLCTPLAQRRTNAADPFSQAGNWERKRAAVLEVCAMEKVHCIDLLRTPPFDMTQEPFFAAPTDYATNNGIYTMDGVHLNKYGAQIVGDMICAELVDDTLAAQIDALKLRGAGPVSACPVAWTPAQIPLAAWWDPADGASVTLVPSPTDGGVRAGALLDKSGNGLTVTAPSAAQAPGYDASPSSGPPRLVYNGSDFQLRSTAIATLRQPVTIFAAVRDANGSGGQQGVVDLANKIVMRSRQGAKPLAFAGTGLFAPNALPSGRFTLMTESYSGGWGRYGVDGAQTAEGPVGVAECVTGQVTLGNSLAGDAPLNAGLGEVLVVPGELKSSHDTYQRITGYSAWRWGWHEYLDAAHPWRYAPPIIGPAPVPAQLINRGAAIIPHKAGSYYESNIFDPRPALDPADPTKLVMFVTGQAAPVGTGTAAIGLWRASVADPFTWTLDRVVLQSGPAGAWDGQTGDGNGVRLGSWLYVDGLYYLYYASQPTGAIGLATSPDGITWTRYGNAPILTPTGQGRVDGNDVSNPFVIREGGEWTMYYTYRTTAELLPGYRVATSKDGKVWTKAGAGDIITRPHKGLQMESLQVFARDGLYYMVFEMGGSFADATPYRDYLAVAASKHGPFVIRKMLVRETGAASATTDRYHCATPFLLSLAGQDFLFWQGAGDFAQPYTNNHWDLFASRVVGALA